MACQKDAEFFLRTLGPASPLVLVWKMIQYMKVYP